MKQMAREDIAPVAKRQRIAHRPKMEIKNPKFDAPVTKRQRIANQSKMEIKNSKFDSQKPRISLSNSVPVPRTVIIKNLEYTYDSKTKKMEPTLKMRLPALSQLLGDKSQNLVKTPKVEDENTTVVKTFESKKNSTLTQTCPISETNDKSGTSKPVDFKLKIYLRKDNIKTDASDKQSIPLSNRFKGL